MTQSQQLALALAVGLVTYATRIGGFLIGARKVPLFAQRFLKYVPVAAFTALFAPGVVTLDTQMPARLIGAAAAAVAVLWLKQLWAGLVAGMAVFWVVALLTHAL
jgi:branched-subunit amino acid transport protein